jgi:ATP-dependent DNA helicase RecG
MFDVTELSDLNRLAETVELECKLAQGRDGQGEIPKDFWPTYSAMANAHGGVVLLGVREHEGRFSVAGILNPEKLRTDLFNTLNNHLAVSVNLLQEADVINVQIEGKTVLAVNIPAAFRKQKPVYLKGQPLGNTYRRLHDGDRHCDDEMVKRMLAEQVEEERDARILTNFGMHDIDIESLHIYRQLLKAEKPGHPYLEQDDFEFLTSLRGWRRDRQSGESGLTLAGLLMFGRWDAIQDALPHYFLDFQERPEAKTEMRWVDRLVPDGSWTGNLFEFYRRVYRKLTADLKVPFVLKDGQRQDDTPVHEALREALVNSLVHADFTGRVSVLVVKRPDLFGFRNPGGLRLPIEQVIRGGESDCRNRILHQMFLLVGLSERGGSGMPKIYGAWKSQHWRPPALVQRDEPEQTVLTLHMADLLPESVLIELRSRFGPQFDELGPTARLVMATAAMERVVSHNRLIEICDAHAHDLSTLLARLVKQGLLASSGRSRATVYFLPGERLLSPEQVFIGSVMIEPPASTVLDDSEYAEVSPEYAEVSSEYSGLTSAYSQSPTGQRDAQGRLLSEHLSAPIIDNLDALDQHFRSALDKQAHPAVLRRLSAAHMEQIILAICEDHYVTRPVLAQLVKRNPDGLRQQYLSRLVRNGQMSLAFPSNPTHEKQAYRAAKHTATELPDSAKGVCDERIVKP